MSEPVSQVLVFVPTLSDRTELPGILADVDALGAGYKALVIDDGSVPPVLLPAGRRLLVRLPANMGLGVCTHVAFDHALRHGYQAVVRIDGDGQHRVQDIPRVVAALTGADFVVGARTNPENVAGGLDGLGRRLLKHYFSLMARLLTGGGVPTDVNSGFFAANVRAMRLLNQSLFERFPEPEIFISAYRLGLRVTSVPIEQRQRVEGRSRLGVLAGLRMFFRFNVFAVGQLLRRKGR